MDDDQRLVEWDWLMSAQGERLHYADLLFGRATELADEGGLSDVTFACGQSVEWAVIPGVFSRMGLPRCNRCCKAVGYPRGVGSPKNDDACRPFVEARISA